MTKEQLQQNPLLIIETINDYATNEKEVEPEIAELLNANCKLINKANKMEVYKGFCIFITSKNPSKYIRIFKEVFFMIIPELQKTYGFEQKSKWHVYDVFEHTLRVLDETSPNLELRIAALFHDIGKPKVAKPEYIKLANGEEKTILHFTFHNIESSKIFHRFANTYNIPTNSAKLIDNLIVFHDYQLSTHPNRIKEYIKVLGNDNIPLLFELKRADNLAQNLELSKKNLEENQSIEKEFQIIMKELKDDQNTK